MTASRPQQRPPSTRRLVAGLHGIAVALLLLHWYVRTLPPTAEAIPPPESAEAAWWGLWPITYLPAPLFWAGVVIVLGLVEWAWLPQAWSPDLPRRAARVRPWVWLIGPSLLLAAAFYLWPIVHTRWGDAYILNRTIAWPDPSLRLTHSWQAPLDVFLHSRVWLALHEPFGWQDAMPVYRLLSPIAGMIYLAAAIGVCVEVKWAPAWLVYGLLASLGLIQLFFGYIENYSFAAAGILLYLWLGARTLGGKTPLWLTALVLALTNATHPSTVVLGPSLLYVGWAVYVGWTVRGQGGGGTNGPVSSVLSSRTLSGILTNSFLKNLAAIALPMALVAGGTIWLMEAGQHGLHALMTIDQPGGGDASWFVPLWETRTRWEAYTLLSWPHVRDLLNQIALVAPVVLPSLAGLGLWRWRAGRRQNGAAPRTQHDLQRRVGRFWMIAALGHLLLIVVWNPDYGGQRDWDLFSLASIASTLWLIGALPRLELEEDKDTQWIVRGFAPLVALQVWHTAAWVYQNTLPWSWP